MTKPFDQYAAHIRSKVGYHLKNDARFPEQHHEAILDLAVSSVKLRMLNGRTQLTDDDAKAFLRKTALERPGYTEAAFRPSPLNSAGDGVNSFDDAQLAAMTPRERIALANRVGKLERGSDGLYRRPPNLDADV